MKIKHCNNFLIRNIPETDYPLRDPYLGSNFVGDILRTSLMVSLSPFLGHEQDFHMPQFQAMVSKSLRDSSPEVYKLAIHTRDKILGDVGFAILQGVGFLSLPDPIRDLFILGFTAIMGYATATDKVKKKVLWPVKVESNPILKNLTFSQRLGEAAYHTDTQYFKYPEEMFSLWCICPDKNGDGANGLVDVRYIIEILDATLEGKNILDTLANTDFPFIVPSVFTAEASDEAVEVYFAPILSMGDNDSPTIRYRRDAIDRGVVAAGIMLTQKQRYAIDTLDQILAEPRIGFRLFLEKEEVLFVNNHKLLHSRSDFKDPERHLIRIRFNSHKSA